VHFVRDGEEAIAYLGGVGRFADRAAYPLPGLLVVDLKMARMDGFEAIEWVRTKSDLRGMPIAVLSSSGDPCDISRAYRLGANAYLSPGACLGSRKAEAGPVLEPSSAILFD